MPMPDRMMDRMRELYAEGMFASAIGRELAGAFPHYQGSLNRNAVIGMITRARVKNADDFKARQVHKTGAARVRKRKPRAVASTVGTVPDADTDPEFEPIPQDISAFMPAPGRVVKRFLSLRSGECRWPYDHRGGLVFCAAPTERAPYCTEHAAVAYRGAPAPKLVGPEWAPRSR